MCMPPTSPLHILESPPTYIPITILTTVYHNLLSVHKRNIVTIARKYCKAPN